MKNLLSALFAGAALISGTTAHYNFESLIVNGQNTGPYQYVRRTSNSNSPITDLSSNDLHCNAGGASGASTSTVTVSAGSKVGFYINDKIGHPGPLSVYMSKAPSLAKDYDGSGDWFKIYEQGLKSITDQGITWRIDNTKSFEFVIPKETPNGEYLIRGEHIGLHGAGSAGGAQVYIGCAQVKVVDGGSGSPSPTARFPGAYKASDPGLLINIYWPIPQKYVMPGPAMWSAARVANPDAGNYEKASARRHARDIGA